MNFNVTVKLNALLVQGDYIFTHIRLCIYCMLIKVCTELLIYLNQFLPFQDFLLKPRV